MKKQVILFASMILFAGMITFTSCKDSSAPVITVTGGNTQTQALPSTAGAGTWTNPTATATDDTDGDISSKITVSGTVDPNTAGTYTLTYSVTDAGGNTTTQQVSVTITNTADVLERSYTNCKDSCNVSGVFNYTSTVTASNTVNGEFVINNFGQFGLSININASLNGAIITVPAGQSLGGTGSLVSASGVVTSTSPAEFNITYSWTDGSATEGCTAIYR